MHAYPIHTLSSAPAASRPSLDALHQAFGVLPNIAGALANSPVLIDSLVAIFGKVHDGSFSEEQIQVVLLTDAVVNASEWPVAFHSVLAVNAGISEGEVEAIREGRLPRDGRLAALSALARALIEKRGRLSDHDKQTFSEAGFSPENLLEVVAIVAASTITNYTASITKPPLEEAFKARAWTQG